MRQPLSLLVTTENNDTLKTAIHLDQPCEAPVPTPLEGRKANWPHRYCPRCSGTGFVLTQNGEILIKFLHRHKNELL